MSDKIREEFESWYIWNLKYIDPLDMKAWMQEAYAAGRKAGMEEAAKVCDDLVELNRAAEKASMWQWEECAAAIREAAK